MSSELLTEKVNWLVEEYIHDDDPSLVETLQRKGYVVKIFPHDFRLDALKKGYEAYVRGLFDNTNPIVFHGSLDTAKFLAQYGGSTYKQFANFDSLHTINYYADENLSPYLLNQNYIYLPLWKVFSMLKAEDAGKEVFIRPDSPFKEFTGQLIPGRGSKGKPDYEEFCRKNSLLPSVAASLLTMVASSREIRSEARFVISKEGILSASYYRMDGEIVYKNIPLDSENGFVLYMQQLLLHTEAFTNLLAHNKGVLVVDVAHVSNMDDLLLDYKVIEVGSFSTSSLYDADFDRIVDKVSLLAYRNEVGVDEELVS